MCNMEILDQQHLRNNPAGAPIPIRYIVATTFFEQIADSFPLSQIAPDMVYHSLVTQTDP